MDSNSQNIEIRLSRSSGFNNKLKYLFIIFSLFLIANFLFLTVKDDFSATSNIDKYIKSDELHESKEMSRILRVESLSDSPEDREQNITYFFNNVSSHIYTGDWTSSTSLQNFEKKSGRIRSHTANAYNPFNNETYIISAFKFYDGLFIDNWYYVKTVNNITDTTADQFNFTNQSIDIPDSTGFIVLGHLFDKVSNSYECKMSLTINYEYGDKDENGYRRINRISGGLKNSKSCEVNIDISFNSLTIEDQSNESMLYVYYSIIVCALCLTQMYNTIWLNIKIQDSYANSNSLSLFTVGQNIIWNAYGCLCHFFLAVNNDQYVPHFGIPAFFFFTNFSVFELRLLYNLWRNQNIAELNDTNNIRRKLIKFYITFYIFLFLSLFFVTKFYFERPYILGAVIVTWLPQIIHNAVYRNQTSMPLISILLISINKILLPVYFRGCEKNMFHIKTDTNFIYICVGVLAFEMIVVYMQALCGPRFFIPCKLSVQQHKYYYSKDELVAVKKEFEFTECAICLYQLFSSESLRKMNDSYVEMSVEERPEIGKCRAFFSRVYNIVFDFHEYHFWNKKPFMLTSCMHAFHTVCMESWLRQKRECPTDRTPIGQIDY